MPILTPAAPQSCEIAFLKDLPAFLTGGPTASETFAGKAPSIPSVTDVKGGITAAVEVFSLDLRQVAHGAAAFRPAANGWNLFAGGDQNKTVTGRMVQRRNAWKLVGVNYGALVFETLALIHELAKMPPKQFATEPYALRLLLIPGLNLQLFWLYSRTGEPDWLLATPSASKMHDTLELSSPREASDVFPQLRVLAASLTAMDAKAGA
jgi:hypothetical protein